jgi:hypothetical protein
VPYSGPSDDGLPANVKKLPENKRAQWVHVFNTTVNNCMSENKGGGAGTQQKCEAMAFRFANGVAKKELEEMEEKAGRMISAANAAKLKAAMGEIMAIMKAAGMMEEEESKDIADEPEVKMALAAYDQEKEEISLLDKLKELLFGQKAATKTEDGQSFPAADFAYVPDAEKPSGWKLRLAESPGKATIAQVARAITALQPSGFRGQKVEIASGDKGGVVSKISAAIGKIAGASDEEKDGLRKRLNAVKSAASAFTLTKDKGGNLRWLTVTSNRFYDRDEEVFPEAVHKQAVALATAKKEYPELWLWHTPGTRIGGGDWGDYADGFRFDSGTIDPGMEGVAMKLAAMPDIGVSHGFKFVREGDTYVQYKTHEVSPLPRRYAANPWTGLVVDKEDKDMGFTAEKRAFLVEALGEEKVSKIEEGAAQLSKELEGAGAAFKDLLPADGGGEAGAESQAVDVKPILEEIRTGVSKMGETLVSLQATVAEHKEAIKELQRSDDEKIAAKAGPRRALRPEDAPANKDSTAVKDESGEPVIANPNGETPVSPFVDQLKGKLGLSA